MPESKPLDHMGYEIDAVGPKAGLASLSTFGRPGRTKPVTAFDGKGNIVPQRYYNPLRMEWQDMPPPSMRIASTEDGTPLSFAEKAPPRDTADPPRPLTVADIARAHGAQTMKRIRGV